MKDLNAPYDFDQEEVSAVALQTTQTSTSTSTPCSTSQSIRTKLLNYMSPRSLHLSPINDQIIVHTTSEHVGNIVISDAHIEIITGDRMDSSTAHSRAAAYTPGPPPINAVMISSSHI